MIEIREGNWPPVPLFNEAHDSFSKNSSNFSDALQHFYPAVRENLILARKTLHDKNKK